MSVYDQGSIDKKAKLAETKFEVGKLIRSSIYFCFFLFVFVYQSGQTLAAGDDIFYLNDSINKVSESVYSGKFYVTFNQTPASSDALKVENTLTGAKLTGSVPGSDILIYSYSGNFDQAKNLLIADDMVKSVAPVGRIYPVVVPDDSLFSQQWNLDLSKISGAESGWGILGDDIGQISSTVKVAVVDSGTERNHQDLSGKIASDDFINCGGNPPSCSPDSTLSLTFDHGTFVGGLIGAVTNNSIGMASSGWGVRLASVKILDEEGTDLDVAMAGVKYAADRGYRIINMSFGADETVLSSEDIIFIQNSIDYAWQRGAFLVGSAGNSAAHGNARNYPAAANHVLSVGSLGRDGLRAFYSQHGLWVDITTGGGNCNMTYDDRHNCVISTTLGNSYKYSQGTSFSAPLVSGVAALMLAVNPNLTNQDLENILKNTADPTIEEGITGYGKLNAYRAVYSAKYPNPSLTPTTDPPTVTPVVPSPTSQGPTPTQTLPSNTPTQPSPTTGMNPTETPSATPPVPTPTADVSCSNYILSGEIFGDQNGNNVKDQGEVLLTDRQVRLRNNSGYDFIRYSSDGRYEFADISSGNYELSATSDSMWEYSDRILLIGDGCPPSGAVYRYDLAYQPVLYPSPTVFLSNTPIPPTNTPKPTATQSPIPTRIPSPTVVPSPTIDPDYRCPDYSNCPMKMKGDANCDNVIDMNDYSILIRQFDTYPAGNLKENANFFCVQGKLDTYRVNMIEFEILRKNVKL